MSEKSRSKLNTETLNVPTSADIELERRAARPPDHGGLGLDTVNLFQSMQSTAFDAFADAAEPCHGGLGLDAPPQLTVVHGDDRDMVDDPDELIELAPA